MLTRLINLSNEIRKDPSLTEHVSRMTAFSKYARYEDTIAALRYANSVKARQKAHNPADAGVTFCSPESAPSRNPADQMLESIDTLLDEHEIDAGERGIIPLRIARLAVSQHISFEKLKRIMESCDFDNTAIMAKLKPEEKPKTIEPDAKDSSSLPQLNTLTPINLPSLALLIHAEGGKEPFTTWYNDLRDKKRQYLVTMYLDKLQREHPVDVKALSSAKPDGQVVGLYELRIHECGLRVYFRYVPNNRIILLGGGGKTNLNAQSRDITTCALRALQYNGRAAESAAALREWSKEQTDS
jgi:putative addiction module killer protein